METLFSQLCDQFMMRRKHGKKLTGIARPIATKITALTLIQLVNQREGNKINSLKIVTT